MNMLLHGLPDARLEKGDTIRDPKLVEDGVLLLYDRVIANPPFSLDEWGQEAAENDGYRRFKFGMPPMTKGDLAFIQHMVAVLNKEGRLGVVVPHGVLFRGGAEGKIRQRLLEEDLIEAVISLPHNLFYGTPIPTSILVLSRNKVKKHRENVLFIEASRDFKERSSKNQLREKDVRRISRTFHGFSSVKKYARVVPLTEIRKKEWTLNVSHYVESMNKEERINIVEAMRKLQDLEEERNSAEETMKEYLEELGLG